MIRSYAVVFQAGAHWLASARVRSALAAAIGLAGAVFLAAWLNRSQTLHKWLAFDLAVIWAWVIYLSAACAIAGAAIVARLIPATGRSLVELAALGFPAGLVTFVTAMYVGGYLHLFGPAFAIALPAAMIGAGARPARALWRQIRSARPDNAAHPTDWLAKTVGTFGLIALGVVYLGVMTPDAINYDAGWNHLVIAQDYARERRIVPFPGDWIKNLPHLGSVVNTWAFLVPGLGLPALRWMLALHIEFSVFVWTLIGVAASARWLSGRASPASWAAFVLFPGIFVYDGNLGGAADHFLALFAAPLLLATGKALPKLDRGASVLWGGLAGGALLTKAQALYVVAPLAAALIVRAATFVGSRRRGDWQAPAGREVATTALLTAVVAFAVVLPHLLGNAIFFRNPAYPLLQDVFRGSTPTVEGAAYEVSHLLTDWHWRAPEELRKRLAETAQLALTFSFVPHYSFVNNLPVFGSTFTLSLAFLPLLRRPLRLWLGVLGGLGGVATWAFTYRLDRNLQAITPVLIAVTAATLSRTWALGRLARVGVAALVAIQVSWGIPLYFHGSDRMNRALALLRSGIDGTGLEQLRGYRRDYIDLGNSLPKHAKVFLHSSHQMLGIDRTVLLDAVGFQGWIDYRQLKTARDLYDRLHAAGVTHVVWTPGAWPVVSRQEEVIFDVFAEICGTSRSSFGGFAVFPLPPTPPPVEAEYQALLVGMPSYADGLYPVSSLGSIEIMPPDKQHYPPPGKTDASPIALAGEAKAILLGTSVSLDSAATERLKREFREVLWFSAFKVLVRVP